MKGESLRKSDLAILEKIFEREIYGQIYQGKSKRLEWLEENGYVEPVAFTMPGRFPVHVKGWGLTHRGRIAYCETCRGEPDDE